MLPSQFRFTRLKAISFRTSVLNMLGRQVLVFVLALPLLTLCSGCATLSSWFNATLSPAPVGLTIRQVEPSGKPGVYAVAGSASLPNQTKVTITAVRYFESETPSITEAESNTNYAILDRQLAVVDQGNWETTLNLWQVAPDGRFQEAWQLIQANSGVQLEPAPTIAFLATLDPPNQPSDLRASVESQDNSTQATLARFTTDGELYLQANKTLPIALPTGSTTPPPPSAPRAGRTSSNRSQSAPPASTKNPDSQPDTWSQTNAPLSPDQMLR